MNKLFATLSLLALLCSGCGTVITHTGSGSDMGYHRDGVYRGTVADCGAIMAPFMGEARLWFFLPLGLVDLPLSLTADTLILPFDVAERTAQKKDEQ
jgi:uncharacterized protein YceK